MSYTCRCGHVYDGYAQCFPCPADDFDDTIDLDDDFSDLDDSLNLDDGYDYNDDLPGNPWIYPGSEYDDGLIEFRLNEHILDIDEQEEEEESDISKKKELCLELVDLLEDNKETLGSGKYLEFMNLLKNELYDKLENHVTITTTEGSIYTIG